VGIPCYNEEISIAKVIADFKRELPESYIIVVDNNSMDKTVHIARKYGAQVLYESKQGKGHAIKKGFSNIRSKYTVMIDADNTYDPCEAKDLIKPLKDDKADVILGSRLKGKRENGSITQFNLFGNHILSLTASILFSKVSDVCTGYWAFKKDVVDCILEEGIASSGFELEVEMFIKIYNNNFKIIESPINYKTRLDSPKLDSISDGWKIFKTLLAYKLISQKNDSNEDKDSKKYYKVPGK
jgi:glycosyltransferase involved in cell wall biosynthesis